MPSKLPDSFLENIATILPDADAAIGAVTLSWGNAHYMIYNIFACVSGMDNEVAESVFFALRADSLQRDVTIAATKARLGDIQLAKDICETINEVGKVAGLRNAFIHTIWAYSDTDKAHIPMPSILKNKKLQRNPGAQANELLNTLKKIIIKLAKLHWSVMLYLVSLDKSQEQPT